MFPKHAEVSPQKELVRQVQTPTLSSLTTLLDASNVFDPFPCFFPFPYIGPAHTTHKINLFCHNVISSLTCDNYREKHEGVTHALCSCLVIEETLRGVA